jgi:hypothetical protein
MTTKGELAALLVEPELASSAEATSATADARNALVSFPPRDIPGMVRGAHSTAPVHGQFVC